MEENNNSVLLNAMYKNVRMGTYAISNIIDMVQSVELKDLINKQNKIYERITKECENFSKNSGIAISDVNPFLKGMSYMGIKVDTIANKKTSHIAQKMIEGTTMGICDIIIKKSEAKTDNVKLNNIADEIQQNEELFIESLKEFLTK